MFILRKFRSILNKPDISTPDNSYRNDNEVTSHEADEAENVTDQDIEVGLLADTIDTKMAVTDEPEPVYLPNIYVDANVLERFTGLPCKKRDKNAYGFIYELNGAVFHEDASIDDKLMRFEVRDHFEDNQDHVSLREDVIQEQFGAARSLPITIQKTPYGLLINSNIIVTENAWNTIICSDEATCTACNKRLDIREIGDHIATEDHKYVLDKFKPLEEFEMNIVRKIDSKYHCGICNITFDETVHLESVSHGDTFLRALNKVSDIQTDDIDNGSEANGNRNAIEDSSGFDSESFDGFYDDVRSTDYNDSESDDRSTKTDKGDNSLFSYADIAKKPKTFETSEYIHVKLDDRTAKVKFDCWHMIIKLKTNNFYCMACKIDGPIRNKTNHCLKLDHVENLMKCSTVPDYKEHVIRKVDDKLYHCGNCNNLHMLHEIKDHLETNHKKYVMANITLEREPLSKCTVIKSSPRAVKKYNAAASAASSFEDKDRFGNVANDNNNPNVDPRGYSRAIANIPASLAAPNPANIADATLKAVVPNQPAPAIVSAKPSQTANNLANAEDRRNIAAKIPFNQAAANIPPNPTPAYEAHRGSIPSNQSVKKSVLPIEYIIVRVFDQMYRIALSAFNSIQVGPNGYFCLICDVWCSKDVRGHVADAGHAMRIAHAPFLPQTSFHLIRGTKYGFHCVVCDIVMRTDPINHTWDRMHLAILNTVINSVNKYLANAPVVHQKQTIVKNSDQAIMTVEKKTDKKEPETKDNEDKSEERVKLEEKDFDSEGYLYVKVKNVYTKITMMAYNGLVQVGNGARYCVLCSVDVFSQDLKAHVFSKVHILNLEQCKFLKKYERHLLRQLSLYYHCALCNVCVLKKFLNKHIVWETHTECELNKIVIQNEIKSGVKEVTCLTQKEINADMKNDFEILVHIKFGSQDDFTNRRKVVNINGVILKLSWDAFHGLSKRKNGHKCILCQVDFKTNEMSTHVEKPEHLGMLENSFLQEHTPALIRKIKDSTLHCLTCNVEVNNEKQSIIDHKVSRGHTSKYTSAVTNKSECDVSDEILILKWNNCKKEKKRTISKCR